MSECVHHWEIETADGPISKGRCLRCKETREFENSINSSVYNGKKFLLGRSEPGKGRIA